MDTNVLPRYDMSDNPTGCCPRFKAEGWDEQVLHFKDKLFLKAETRSIMHIPVNMHLVFPKTLEDMKEANAMSEDDFIVLSHDPSAIRGEHLFAVTREVPDHEMVRLTGEFMTRVFEGNFKSMPGWAEEMEKFVKSKGRQLKKTFFFYTTCPKCAKEYGKNYVVGVAEVE